MKRKIMAEVFTIYLPKQLNNHLSGSPEIAFGKLKLYKLNIFSMSELQYIKRVDQFFQ